LQTEDFMSDIDKKKPTTQESAEILELEESVRAKHKAKVDNVKEDDRF
jgi:hypothetical protein